jgi:transposase
MNYCGIDVANKTSCICIINDQGAVLHRETIATESGDLESALQGLGELKVIIEASPLAEVIASRVEAQGHTPVIIDPRAAKHLVSSKKKTDARDAQTLAEIGRGGWYVAVHRKSQPARIMRSQLRARQALQKQNKALLSSIRGLLRAHGIQLGKVSEGQFVSRVTETVEQQLPELLTSFKAMLEIWEMTRTQVNQLKAEIEQACKEDTISQCLESVPGIGPLISTAYRATIDDPQRFKNGKEVADYIGLAPRIYQSGEVEYRGRITKEGDSLLRWHLVEGAHVLLTHGQDCALKRWGLALQERKGSAKAKVAVARKLAVLLWKLWKEQKKFEAYPQPA